jgi:hypothetical protein
MPQLYVLTKHSVKFPSKFSTYTIPFARANLQKWETTSPPTAKSPASYPIIPARTTPSSSPTIKTESNSFVRLLPRQPHHLANGTPDALLSLLRTCGITHQAPHADLKLLYSRKPNDRIVATLVVLDLFGAIEAKIEPPKDGKDQAEACLAFRKYVEVRLHEMLQKVPEAGGGRKGEGSESAGVPMEQPPSYDDTGKSGVSVDRKK